MAKVDQKAKFKAAGFQVIENLGSMLVSDFADGLEFNDYLVVADKVGEIFLVENSTSIFQRQSGLRDCWNAAMFEFNAKAFLVNRLVEAAALVFIDFEAGTNNGVTLILED